MFLLGFILLNCTSVSPLTSLLKLALAAKTSGGTLGSCFNVPNSLCSCQLCCLADTAITTTTPGCLLTSAGCVCLWIQKRREKTYLLSNNCNWKCKMPAEAAGGSGLMLLLCITAATAQTGSAPPLQAFCTCTVART